MSKYEVNTILSMWAQDKLTVEQAVGQILQHLQALLGRVGQVEKQMEQLRRQEVPPPVVLQSVLKPEVVLERQPEAVAELAEPVGEVVELEDEVGEYPSEVSEISEDLIVVPDDEGEAAIASEEQLKDDSE